jgi:hypothetical protein
MRIDLCFHIFKFEKRFFWVLNSLSQQINNPFKLHIKVAAHKTLDNFRYILDEMLKTFPKLEITICDYDNARFNARGQTRTDQIKNCQSDYILFLDGDNIFPPQFFSSLHPLLGAIDKRKVISVPRLTMDAREGYRLVDSVNDYTKEIPNVYEKVSAVKTRPSFNFRVSGAGYFQLTHYPTMKSMGINSYVDGSYDSPILDANERFCTKSDIVFRKRFDGVHPIVTLPKIIHINHFRRSLDKEYDFNKCN